MKNTALLDVEDLKVEFHKNDSQITVVEDVNFTINEGETIGLVGESGSGKSVTSLSLMRLISEKTGKLSGSVYFNGRNLLDLKESDMRKIRGNEIAMIFQEPMTSLNPVYSIGSQIAESVMLHQNCTKQKAWEHTYEMLRLVGISDPESRAKQYPHQMSGGLRQRVMIAMALSCNPKLLIADEPTTALDVTIQAQVMELMKEIKQRFNSAILIITHDLGVIADMADRVLVMYAGKIVESADVYSLFKSPLHPYTEALLKSIPQLNGRKERLHVIEGNVPTPQNIPKGCRFHPRCKFAKQICLEKEPKLTKVGENHSVSCWLHEAEKNT